MLTLLPDRWVFDCEVTEHDWLFVFKHKGTNDYAIFHNDNDSLRAWWREEDPLLVGFNSKRYDQFILKGVIADKTPEEIKEINDDIIERGIQGWDLPQLREYYIKIRQYDLMDDMQVGQSLKSIEGHLGMDITETTVDFNIDHHWTDEERTEMIYYCKHDVDATDNLDDLRLNYLETKLFLGKECGLTPYVALSMTNAKLTASYLRATPKKWNDEREYQYPTTLKREYIPQEVFNFFDRMHDKSIPDEELFSESLEINVGGCPCKLAYGGIHGAIPVYSEETTETRVIRNKDVASYYPHQMTVNGYCSRNIPSPQIYEATIERRVEAKRSGNKALADALKLVLNTTYGAMLNAYNNLYDPLMGRSVCISGQLQLLELAEHLVQECPTLKIIQLNTDGIMVSMDLTDEAKWQEITQEWQDRTGFELEEDTIKKIVQRDVNNYVEVAMDGSSKIKGGVLVRGIAPAGAFKVNNTFTVVSKAVAECLANGVPVADTINACNDPKCFQLIAKAGSKYTNAFHEIDGKLVEVQKVNRVYASSDPRYGTLYKKHKETGSLGKIPDLPLCCIVDNKNELGIEVIDKDWYIRLAQRYVNEFLGIKPPKRNTRAVNKLKKQFMELLKEEV